MIQESASRRPDAASEVTLPGATSTMKSRKRVSSRLAAKDDGVVRFPLLVAGIVARRERGVELGEVGLEVAVGGAAFVIG
jgi:hypothetical protein